MTDINSCTFTGRLTKDCESRSTLNGSTVVRFSFANNWYSANTKKEEVSYFDAVMFGKLAESLSPYLRKGVAITLSGELRQQRFVTKDGKNASREEIIVDSIKLQDRREDASPKAEPQSASDDGLKGPESMADDFSDIPF